MVITRNKVCFLYFQMYNICAGKYALDFLLPANHLQLNTMAKTTDDIIVFLLMLVSILFEAVKTSFKHREIPIKRTKTELKKMLKSELVELVITYQ